MKSPGIAFEAAETGDAPSVEAQPEGLSGDASKALTFRGTSGGDDDAACSGA